MRSKIRVSLMMLVACSVVAVSAPAAAQATPGFGVEKFFAGNCKATFEKCGEKAKEGTLAEAEKEGYTQAGGHPNFGVTDFIIKTVEAEPGLRVPSENVTHVRVDVAPGVVTNPQAVPKCSIANFTGAPVAPGVFTEPNCAGSVIGENQVETVLEFPEKSGKFVDAPLSGKVYNLEQETGWGSTFGVALKVAEPAPGVSLFAHTIIKGSVEWASDYHDLFEIENIPPGLIESRLVFKGQEPGTSGFLRNGTQCAVPGPETTTTVTVTNEHGVTQTRPYQSLVGATGCGLAFGPTLAVTPETAVTDQPDGLTVTAKATHPLNASETDVSDLKIAEVKLPEGLTMNPSAAAGLEACTLAQIGIGTRNAVTCPPKSAIGTVNLEVPTLPPGSLQGPIYLGNEETPAGSAIKGPPYTIYLDAESSRYNIKVRVKGKVVPNPTTGQLTTTFSENPQAPFNEVVMHFNGGAFAPLANPLVCGTGTTNTTFTPFSNSVNVSSALPFSTVGCASSPPPFSWSQASSTTPTTGGATSAFTFTLARNEGQQYLEKTSVQLPPGLVAKVPAVALCPEAQANAGTCPVASKIGTVAAKAGSGTPFTFPGNVYLTEKFQGAPYGLSFVVPVVAGPFNLGTEVTRSKIEVNPNTARVTVNTPKLPTIRGGVPVRLRSLVVSITAPNYILNPTNCSVLQTESLLTSTLGSIQNVSTPFQATGCSGLAFKPSFKAATTALTSKNNGASLETTINQPGKEANIKSVVVTLPKAMPSRLTTLQKACPAATFNANPFGCPSGSYVGGARANTPVLPNKMTGPAVLVSHGGAAFPDLDLVLEANGVRVIVVGNTNIVKGITTTSFVTTPDVPVTSITVNLPTGSHSALGAVANFCTTSLVMPTTITGQNGKVVKQNTKIAVAKCPIQVIGHKVVGNEAVLTVETFSAGRISGSGKNLKTVARHLNSASKKATLRVPLSSGGKSKGRPFTANVRVGFFPKKKGAPTSVAHVNVFFP